MKLEQFLGFKFSQFHEGSIDGRVKARTGSMLHTLMTQFQDALWTRRNPIPERDERESAVACDVTRGVQLFHGN